jgi:PPM family protein phosphatase
MQLSANIQPVFNHMSRDTQYDGYVARHVRNAEAWKMTHLRPEAEDGTSLDVGQACHIGLIRSLNEDRVLALTLPPSALVKGEISELFAVADGIGGCEGGEIASDVALKALSGSLSQAHAVAASDDTSAEPSQAPLRAALDEGVRTANRAVFARGQAGGVQMGTTLVAALVSGTTVYIANVGDSRAYLLQEGVLHQVTSDHSVVGALLAAGLIAHDEVYTHPQRSVITRSIGMGPGLEVDLYAEELRAGTALLLCSDGLWEMVRDDQIRRILLESPQSQGACDELVRAANRNGGTDNISVIVIRTDSGNQ